MRLDRWRPDRLVNDHVHEVAILVESVLDRRNRSRFGIDWMIHNGIKVTVYDVGPLTLPEIGGDRSHYDTTTEFEIVTVETVGDLRCVRSSLAAADLIVNLVGTALLTPRNMAVYRTIAAAGTPYLILSVNAYPGWSSGYAWVGLFQRLRRINPLKSIIGGVNPGWIGISHANFVVYGGRMSRTANRFVGESTKPITAYALDYEICRDIIAEMPPTATDTVVFIDEYCPYHPDLKEMGISYSPRQANAYFRQMRAVFDRVEDELGLEVVVAAMPKADYSLIPTAFGDRRMEFGRTAGLIAESRLVLAHRSTAIGYAVMFNKPVLQVASRELYGEPSQKPCYDAFAEALGKPIQFTDETAEVDLSIAFDLDGKRYAEYMKDYVAESAIDAPFWKIVIESVDRSFRESALSSPAT